MLTADCLEVFPLIAFPLYPQKRLPRLTSSYDPPLIPHSFEKSWSPFFQFVKRIQLSHPFLIEATFAAQSRE